MNEQQGIIYFGRRTLTKLVALCVFIAASISLAQQPSNSTPPSPSSPGQSAPPSPSKPHDPAKPQHDGDSNPETRITPEQAKELFGLVDDLLKFSSQETGFQIKGEVKRKLTTRNAVESYLNEKFQEDEDAKRMQRSEIVLKKFGMLDRDFNLKPFLLALLKEQIEAYYDPKTKTVNLLDWIGVEEQKPVLAHELTHALQDQHTDLEKWSDQTPSDVSHNSTEDSSHIAKDELDTAREAVTEGQATAVMMDNILKPMGKSLIKDPEVVDFIKQQMAGSENSPVLARAPLLLSESLLFPYREGLSFEQDVWMDRGQTAAFAGALDRPPTSTWEIINPREYEKGHVPTVPLLPDIHPLVDPIYRPYDIGQVGQLDLHILAGLFGGDNAARDLTPAWDGGLYWAGQRLSATTPAEQASTKSISLFYLSLWKSPASAQAFARLYAQELGRKYSGFKLAGSAENTPPANIPEGTVEKVYSTNEGPVVITERGKLVFVTESFDLPMARKLSNMILDAQGTGALQLASMSGSGADRGLRNGLIAPQEFRHSLTGNLVRFMAGCGVMKSVVDSALKVDRTHAGTRSIQP